MEALIVAVLLLAALWLAHALGLLRLFNPGIGALGRRDQDMPAGMQEEDRQRRWGRR